MSSITFSKQRKTFSLSDGDREIDGWSFGIEIDGTLYDGSACKLRHMEEAESGLIVTVRLQVPRIDCQIRVVKLTLDDDAKTTNNLYVRISAAIKNLDVGSVSLGKFYLFRSDGILRFGEGDAEVLCLPLSGDLGPRRVYRILDQECPRTSKIKTQFYAKDTSVESGTTEVAFQVGFLTFHRCDTNVSHDVSATGRLSSIEAWCDFGSWDLEPEHSTRTEVLQISYGEDPFYLLERWTDAAALRIQPRSWEDAPIGWLGWAWVDPFTVETYEDVVRRNVDAIDRRLAGFGIDYVWVSIGNLAGGTPGRWTQWNYDLFPSGPKGLKSLLDSHSLKWGLWCGPFWVCALAEDELLNMGNALLRDNEGDPIVARPAWNFGDSGVMDKDDRPPIYALDPSHPDAQDFIREAFETWRNWGVRYYMIDFLDSAAGSISGHTYSDHFDRSLVAGPEVYHAGLETIRQAVGDDTYLLTSTGPSIHNAGFADAIRTGSDFGEGRALYQDSYFYPATFVINDARYWTGPARALQNQASSHYTHRRLYINDSGNVLTVDKPIPLESARIAATIHAMSGGPSMLGDDIDRIDSERLSLIKATLPRPRDVARPVDLFRTIYPDQPKVFHRHIERQDEIFDVVALYNMGNEPISELIDFGELRAGHLTGEDRGRYAVWEFWNSQYLGTATSVFTAKIPPQSVRVFRFTRIDSSGDDESPVVLGTDMHVLMGEVELSSCRWDKESSMISGKAIRPAGETGNVFVRIPAGYRVTEPSGKWIAKDANDSSLIVGLRLRFESEPIAWSVSYAPI